jgi:hypothetical protein
MVEYFDKYPGNQLTNAKQPPELKAGELIFWHANARYMIDSGTPGHYAQNPAPSKLSQVTLRYSEK